MRSRTPMMRGGGTPGPGSYMLPSDFGYLENKNSPRNLMSTQGSFRRGRGDVSRLQLSTMTGYVNHNLENISINESATGRNRTSTTIKSQNIKKRN